MAAKLEQRIMQVFHKDPLKTLSVIQIASRVNEDLSVTATALRCLCSAGKVQNGFSDYFSLASRCGAQQTPPGEGARQRRCGAAIEWAIERDCRP